jgi:PAS domain S-box-containing protein
MINSAQTLSRNPNKEVSSYSMSMKNAHKPHPHDFNSLIDDLDSTFFFFTHDAKGLFTYVSPSVTPILGYTQEEFLQPFDAFLTDHPVNANVIKNVDRSIMGAKLPPYELELFHKNGSVRRLKVYVRPDLDGEGNVVSVHGIAEDIAEQKCLEESLHHKETLFAKMQKMAHVGSWSFDIRNNRLEWSDEIYRIFEIDSDTSEASYKAFINAIHPDDREMLKAAYRRSLKENTPHSIEHRLLMPDGRIKYVSEACETICDDAGQPLSSFGTVQDITAIIALQQENEKNLQMLFHQTKMAQMGEMLGSIAHQWKQPLHQINAGLLSLERLYENGHLTRDALSLKLDEIELLTSHMSQTIESFKDFFHPQKQAAPFSVNAAVKKTFSLFQSGLDRSTIDHRLMSTKEFTATGFENEFIQAMLAIMNNARECFIHRDIRHPRITIDIGGTAEEVVVEITDNAGGISEKFIDNIFDPYFTTKRKGHGTGLGLYIAKMLIEKSMHGTLTVANARQGAKFTMRFKTGDIRR